MMVGSLVLLSGCDPFQTPGTWRAAGSNDKTLRAMIADPWDLDGATGSLRSRGNAAADPVIDLIAGKRRSLISVSTEGSGESGAGGGNAAPGQP